MEIFRGYLILLMEEILHQLIGSLSHYLLISLVVQDFFHKQSLISPRLQSTEQMAYKKKSRSYLGGFPIFMYRWLEDSDE